MNRKLPPPTLPKKRKPRRSGLENLWAEEAPTRKVIQISPPDGEIVECPACRGSTFSKVEEPKPPALNTYHVERCPECAGEGQVTAAKAEEILQRLKENPP